MGKYRAIRWLFWKTGIVTVIGAAVGLVRVSEAWGAAFAIGGLLGLINWFAMGCLLIGIVDRKPRAVAGAIGVKAAVIGSMLIFVLPAIGVQIPAFVLGFSTFLFMCFLEGAGMGISEWARKKQGGADRVPKDWREAFLGTRADG